MQERRVSSTIMSANSCLDKTVKKRYLSLPKGAECQVTYVWISEFEDLRSKSKTLDREPRGVEDIPKWYAVQLIDGSCEEVSLVPVRMFRDPFTLDPNKLVLCDVLNANHLPKGANQRSKCATIMEEVEAFRPWFGMEQEFVLFGLGGRPLGWPPQGSPLPEGVVTAMCGVGADKTHGRDVSICHYNACLYAGVKIGGANAENSPSQWEYQVGPCEGIEAGDHLWMSRYILHRVCEDFGVIASLDAKPIEGCDETSGCHTNFSTKQMRGEGGLQHIEEAVQRLSLRHPQHLSVYDPHGGRDNKLRLCSYLCTSSLNEFSSATGSRKVSVRIPGFVSQTGRGYLEDRRPAANCDPYAVTRALAETCLLVTNGDHNLDKS